MTNNQSLLWPTEYTDNTDNVEIRGIEMVFLLDTSNSMNAEDLKPNRLDVSKQLIGSIVDNLATDSVGLINFAAVPYVQCPLTTDYGKKWDRLKYFHWEIKLSNGHIMVYIPPGGLFNKPECFSEGFWISKYEVTIAQYENFFKETRIGKDPAEIEKKWAGKKNPVVNVSWYEEETWDRPIFLACPFHTLILISSNII